MKVAILGGTRGMGRALVRLMAERGDEIVLLGRSTEQLERSAADLQIRGATGDVGVVLCDLAAPDAFLDVITQADAVHHGLDAIVITAAMFATQDSLEDDHALAQKLLTVNFANTVTFCEHAREYLLGRGGGTLCVFSSVAGDRGRKPVGIYGATKAGLSHYLESLDHKYREAGLKTVCVKPGFVKTGMTADLDPPPFAGEPEEVAHVVLDAIDRGTPVVYVPGVWRLIMGIIKHLPRAVMRRVSF